MDGTPDPRGGHLGREHSALETPSARARTHGWRSRVPTLAVVLVVVTAVVTAVMVAPTVSELADHRPVAAGPVAAVPASPSVVQAPPLDSRASAPHQRAGPACRDCGVIESVVALVPRAQDDAMAYQMRIRMDDGSVRTVKQRGALAAGSRVTVADGSVRSASGRPDPG
jgi:hypothetical protein